MNNPELQGGAPKYDISPMRLTAAFLGSTIIVTLIEAATGNMNDFQESAGKAVLAAAIYEASEYGTYKLQEVRARNQE